MAESRQEFSAINLMRDCKHTALRMRGKPAMLNASRSTLIWLIHKDICVTSLSLSWMWLRAESLSLKTAHRDDFPVREQKMNYNSNVRFGADSIGLLHLLQRERIQICADVVPTVIFAVAEYRQSLHTVSVCAFLAAYLCTECLCCSYCHLYTPLDVCPGKYRVFC